MIGHNEHQLDSYITTLWILSTVDVVVIHDYDNLKKKKKTEN